MHIRGADQEGGKRELGPARGGVGDEFEGDQTRETPELGDQADEEALVEAFAEPGDLEQVDDEEEVGGDGEEVGLEAGEVGLLQGEAEVLRGGLGGDEEGQA